MNTAGAAAIWTCHGSAIKNLISGKEYKYRREEKVFTHFLAVRRERVYSFCSMVHVHWSQRAPACEKLRQTRGNKIRNVFGKRAPVSTFPLRATYSIVTERIPLNNSRIFKIRLTAINVRARFCFTASLSLTTNRTHFFNNPHYVWLYPRHWEPLPISLNGS